MRSLVTEHFLNPRNVGEIEDPDGVGAVGDPGCGDMFKVWIRVESELATGMTLEEAYALDDLDIMVALGGLPEPKQHCSNHAATALHRAIDSFVFGRQTRKNEIERDYER